MTLDTGREPACHVDARMLLRKQSVADPTIVRVDVDSILFLDAHGKPFTAWIYRAKTMDGGTRLRFTPGFEAEPPEGLYEAIS